jgi:FkbM family methyltransferase
MNPLPIFLKYARYRYITYRIFLRMKMGKQERDEYIKKNGIKSIDFLPERPYSINGVKAIPRKHTEDFYMFQIPREKELSPHLSMNKGETFVDVGANVGYYSLKIAKNYQNKGVKVIAIEAHPENFKALCNNISCNNLTTIKAVNKAASDHQAFETIYERLDNRNRIRSDSYSLSDSFLSSSSGSSVVRAGGKHLRIQCDTLDNILGRNKVGVMKIDVEGAEVLALRGATNTLKMLRKVIVEVHGNNMDKIKNILDDTHGFEVETLETPIMSYVIGSKLA